MINLETLGTIVRGNLALVEEPAAVDYLIPDLGLTSDRANVLCGYSFAGKSKLAVYMACCVAAGVPLFGQFPVEARPALILDWEQGQQKLCWDIRRIGLGLGVDPERLEQLVAIADTKIHLDDPTAEATLANAMSGFGFCVLDNFRSACPSADENSSDVRRYLDLVSRASRATGCCSLVLHHAGKGNNRTGMQAGRGSSALNDAAAAWFNLRPGKVEGTYALTAEKAVWRGVKPVNFRMVDAGEVDPRSRLSEMLKFELVGAGHLTPEQLILGALQQAGQAPLTRSALAKLVHGRRADVLKEIDRLIDIGALRLDGKLVQRGKGV